ncbi:hypothetical protein Gotri_019816 [Gossypium trilobum]|uniref:Uncharacterized protein n=1 Tax=Gossypium trilobum TaxID=34281 RepID=A0A7J9EE90_9ROSI|nr:hypothetical protein [Gossypium trilobum]
MKKFYQGALSTPKLHKVQLTETDFEGRWAGDLNATIEQLNTEAKYLQHLQSLNVDSSGVQESVPKNIMPQLENVTLHFHQRFSNLEELKIIACNFKELSPR